jgi:hypothetical protein
MPPRTASNWAKRPRRKKAEAIPAPVPDNVPSIIDASRDPDIFGPWFRDETTWANWFVFSNAVFGLEMTAEEIAAFQKFTGREIADLRGYYDVALIVGRRGGKSLILALIAAYLALFCNWRPFLVGGEAATISILAADRRQAATIFRYLREMLSIPRFAGLIERETNEVLQLGNGITIKVLTASFRTTRGRTLVACLCDEQAFWRNDEGTANPDVEIINALRPSMATVPGARLLKASSPYARRGVLWNDLRKGYGTDSRTLVWKASTRDMNPSVPQSFIDEQYADDPASAAAEYGGEFRTDVEAFLSREAVEAVTPRGRLELMPAADVRYVAFVDPSGGSADAMTLAIAHMDREMAALDLVREVRPPFSPESVVDEFASILHSYRVSRVVGDRYAGEWPRERFRKRDIEYVTSERTKSDLYQALLPLINSGRAELLDLPRLIGQLCNLERRTARGGRDSIDHPPSQHDDLANAAAGALVLAAVVKRPMTFSVPFVATQPHYFPGSENPS